MSRTNAVLGLICAVLLGASTLNVMAADPLAEASDGPVTVGDQEWLHAWRDYCIRTEVPECLALLATPTPSATPSPQPSPTPSLTPTPTPAPTATASPTPAATPTPSPTPTPTSSPTPSPTPPPPTSGGYILISKADLMALPMSGAAWNALGARANQSASSPSVDDQDDPDNVTVLAKALIVARTGDSAKRAQVVTALTLVQASDVDRALALGREFGAYVLAADLIGYRDPAFVSWVSRMRTVTTSGGPSSLINCSETRPNNWGTWCMASRIAAERYLGLDLTRSVQVFRGWLGDRAQYVGFSYGDTSWQCNASQPVGINPACSKSGFDIGGVLPDDQRRGGGFTTNPGCENYVHEALQGVTLSATLLHEAGYPAWTWSTSAIRRAFTWLYANDCPASGDDTGNVHAVNHYTGSTFPETAANPGKGWGFQDWFLP